MTDLARVRRPGRGRRLVFLHGFTQTARSWSPIVERIDREFDVTCFDAPGHGDSVSVDTDFARTVELLAGSIEPCRLIGYSMGGRLALALAVERPDIVERLVLVGATPGLDDPSAREQRRHDDDVLAARIAAIGVEAFLHEWLTQELFATLPESAWNLADRRRNSPRGLGASLRGCGTGSQSSYWSRLGELRMPVRLVIGELDTKFSAIAHDIAARIGANAEVISIPGAGHAAHLEDPDRFAALIDEWCR